MTGKAESAVFHLQTAPRLGFRHSRVQNLRALISKRSERDASGTYVIEGLKTISEAIKSGVVVREVFIDGDRINNAFENFPGDPQWLRSALVLASGVMQRVATTVSPQPVIAVADKLLAALPSIKRGPVVVLVDVADPGNAGTIIRSAEASGMRAVIACGSSVDIFSPKVVRSAASAHFNIQLAVAPDVDSCLTRLKEAGFKVFGTRVEDATAYYEADLTNHAAILVGNESHGLPDVLPVDEWLAIPMAGKAESLNAAVAASIVSFETARQLRNAGLHQA